MFARRLQIQRALTSQIAHSIEEKIAPQGVGVIIEARHLCMQMRGVERAMARRSPAPCLVPSLTTSRRETSFSRSCAGKFLASDQQIRLRAGDRRNFFVRLLLLCRRARARGRVAAGAVVAPAASSWLSSDRGNPAAIGIGATLMRSTSWFAKPFSKRSGNPGDHPIPIAPHRSRLGADSIFGPVLASAGPGTFNTRFTLESLSGSRDLPPLVFPRRGAAENALHQCGADIVEGRG